jgi:hypothetical protein
MPLDYVEPFLIPLFSLTGLAVGIGLSYLAREELAAGKKYFIFLYRAIFVILSLIITYYIWFFIFAAILLCVLDFIKPNLRKYLFVLHYLFFLIGYFLAGKTLLVAAILFLYGLPLGTLLWMEKIKKNE